MMAHLEDERVDRIITVIKSVCGAGLFAFDDLDETGASAKVPAKIKRTEQTFFQQNSIAI